VQPIIDTITVNAITNARGLTKWVRGLNNTFSSWFKQGGEGAESIASSIADRSPSRLGVVLGVAAGVIVGAGIIAATAATLGAALPIVGGIVLGSCALAGGVTGHVAANTSPGRRVFMIGATAAAATVLGPVGLVAAPAIWGYNMFSGKRNALSQAVGSTIKGIGGISKRIGQGMSGFSYSDAEVVEAHDIKQAAADRKEKVAKQKEDLDSYTQDPRAASQLQALHSAQSSLPQKGKKTLDSTQVGVAQSSELASQMASSSEHSTKILGPTTPALSQIIHEAIPDSALFTRPSIDAQAQEQVTESATISSATQDQTAAAQEQVAPPPEPPRQTGFFEGLRNLFGFGGQTAPNSIDTPPAITERAVTQPQGAPLTPSSVSIDKPSTHGRENSSATSMDSTLDRDFTSAQEDLSATPSRTSSADFQDAIENPLPTQTTSVAPHASHQQTTKENTQSISFLSKLGLQNRGKKQSLEKIVADGPKSLTTQDLDPVKPAGPQEAAVKRF